MKVPAAFPVPPFYSRSISDAIKAQFRFLNNSLNDECSSDNVMQLENAALINGAIETEEDGKYSFDCPYFGEGDFTIEAKIEFKSWGNSNGFLVFGQYNTGGTADDSWNLRVYGDSAARPIRLVISPGAGQSVTATPAGYDLVLNREYHVVVERVNGVITLYVNGAVYSTLNYSAKLNNPLNSLVTSELRRGDGFGRCARRIRDIRIASRALYRGSIHNNFSGIREAESKPWWHGSVVAYDSECLTLDDSNNFRDYNGVLMKAGKAVWGSNGSLPQRAGSDFQYGEGILISNGSYIVTNTGELLQWFGSYSWSLDFWHRDVDEGKTGRTGIFPIVNYPNVEVSTTHTTRLLIGPGNGDVNAPRVDRYTVWSNAQNPVATGTVPVNLEGIEWRHTAIVYDADSKRLQFYSNGIFTGFMAVTVHPITVLNQFGIGSTNVNRPVLIERYRLRLGMHFNGQFDPDNSY